MEAHSQALPATHRSAQRLEDFCAPLRQERQTCRAGNGDGQVNGIAADQTAAVRKKEDHDALCVGTRVGRDQLEWIGVGQGADVVLLWWQTIHDDLTVAGDGLRFGKWRRPEPHHDSCRPDLVFHAQP